jgi:hypothetical protein
MYLASKVTLSAFRRKLSVGEIGVLRKNASVEAIFSLMLRRYQGAKKHKIGWSAGVKCPLRLGRNSFYAYAPPVKKYWATTIEPKAIFPDTKSINHRLEGGNYR